MTRAEQIAVLRDRLQTIQHLATISCCEADADAIIMLATDAWETAIALLGFPEMERSHTNHLGATSDEH